MCAKYLLDLDLTLINLWRDHYCLENNYNSKTKLSIIFSFAYINKFFNETSTYFTQKITNIVPCTQNLQKNTGSLQISQNCPETLSLREIPYRRPVIRATKRKMAGEEQELSAEQTEKLLQFQVIMATTSMSKHQK